MSVLVSNIQRFSIKDGPGIRTTVFTVGCPLRCPWCANPENISIIPEMETEATQGFSQIPYTVDDLFDELVKDKVFYGNTGGVTFSGGDPILWIDELIPLIEKLHKEGIVCAVETELYAVTSKIRKSIEYFDYWICDVKTLNQDEAKTVLKGNLDTFLENFSYLVKNIDVSNLLIRVPIVKGFNDSTNELDKIIEFLIQNNIVNVQFIFAHGLAKKKYEMLHMEFVEYSVTEEIKRDLCKYLDKVCENMNNWNYSSI